MHLSDFISILNSYGSDGRPFFFLIDFEMQIPFVCPLEDASGHGFLFNLKTKKNYADEINRAGTKYHLTSYPVAKTIYREAFDLVVENIQSGNSYLLNLTFPTRLKSDITLEQIFYKSSAAYKLYHRDRFVLFSPECFIRTQDDHIYSYPMKGTIDALIPDAAKLILTDDKEIREHNTIVDLIRNDLAMVARNITVSKFRYIEKIKTDRNELLQISSEIHGELDKNWRSAIGTILTTMLPAGSISGAPKKKTVDIIKSAEKQKRGYYTGVFGIFDGENIDSAVNIRFIEKSGEYLQYRSGGGITAMSDPDSEYMEMLDKVYVPID